MKRYDIYSMRKDKHQHTRFDSNMNDECPEGRSLGRLNIMSNNTGKEIAIATNWNYPDYGGMLQALATQIAIESIGCIPRVLDVRHLQKDINARKLRYFARNIFDFSIVKEKAAIVFSALKRQLPGEYKRGMQQRHAAFELFCEESFQPSEQFDCWENLTQSVKKYDCVLVGSDQLWLPSNIVGDYYTLNFVPDEVRKASYATSFGVSSIPDYLKDNTRSFLLRFASLSARETSGQDIIDELTGTKVPLVCDPTLLIKTSQWEKYVSNDKVPNEDYIFCYLMGNNPEHRAFVNKAKQETGFKIVSLPHLDCYISSDQSFPDYAPYDIGPAEFLGLIKNASLVCTDSFHGTIFSCLFNKEFCVFPRFKKQTTLSTNSRIDSLLMRLDIKDRLVMAGDIPDNFIQNTIDFSKLNANIASFRRESYNYLKRAVGVTS